MKWRYLNQRMLLYRPTLLSYAMRRVPYIALRSEERTAIERCRAISEATIHDIASTAQSHQMSGWNAVWLLFQATMVPLVGLFLNDNTTCDSRATHEACMAQVEMAMLTLARLQAWSPTAKKTLDAVSRIVEANKRGSDVADEANMSNENVPGPVPGILPSQNELNRGVTIANEGGYSDPFAGPLLDDSTGQYLWDFLTWSDSSLMPGVDNANEAMLLSQDNKGIKYNPGASAFFGGPVPADSAYFANPVSFYG